MNFSLINNFVLTFIFTIILSSCSTKTVYQKFKLKTYEKPLVEDFDEKNIFLNSINYNQINYENNFVLKKLNNNKEHSHKILIINGKMFAFTEDLNLLELNLKTGEIISSYKIEGINISTSKIISFNYIDNSFIVALKSGSILRLNMLGEIIWEFKSSKILNTQLNFINEQIISLYIDEIKSISVVDGTQIWSEVYEDLPFYQSNGGQLVSFLNLLFFILPNNKIGSIDINLGSVHNSSFNKIPLISSINNTKDKIHIFENYIVYLDEGKHLYVFDIIKDDFIMFKKNINKNSSNIFFNNLLVLKEGSYLQFLNINSGKTFFLLNNKDISKSSEIIAIRNIDSNIEIFLNNGEVLVINNKNLIKINNLKVKKIKNITFEKQNIIVSAESGKTIIF